MSLISQFNELTFNQKFIVILTTLAIIVSVFFSIENEDLSISEVYKGSAVDEDGYHTIIIRVKNDGKDPSQPKMTELIVDDFWCVTNDGMKLVGKNCFSTKFTNPTSMSFSNNLSAEPITLGFEIENSVDLYEFKDDLPDIIYEDPKNDLSKSLTKGSRVRITTRRAIEPKKDDHFGFKVSARVVKTASNIKFAVWVVRPKLISQNESVVGDALQLKFIR